MFYTAPMIESINNSFSPKDDQCIARYMDFVKFVDLLENEELHFSNVKFYEDKYEGEIPQGFFKGWLEDHIEGYKKIKKLICHTYVSCWNKFEFESYALWKIYTNPKSGVCLKTTVGKLKKALSNDKIKIFEVKYTDYNVDYPEKIEPAFYIGEENNGPFSTRLMETYKYVPYSFEDEIRGIYVENSPDKFKRFKIDLNELIEEIYISPFASPEFLKLVRKLVYQRFNLKEEIKIMPSKIIV